MTKPKVVIIGGGFGGLHAARSLEKADVNLTLVDKTNHHLFQPLLYQVATCALAPRDIAFPLREILKNQSNASVRMDGAEKIDVSAKTVQLTSGTTLLFDSLIVATGARHCYFNHPEWESVAPGLKTLDNAIAIRQKILLAYEKAEVTKDPEEVERLLTFVIVGAGPTGVELAGALAEIAHRTLHKNFRHIEPESSKIYLVEAGERILPPYPPPLSQKAKENLEKMGVTVLTHNKVESIDKKGVTINGKRIETESVFWAAGNKASPLLSSLNVPLDRQNRVIVGPDLSIPDHPNIFVIGDAAHCAHEDGTPLPGVAPVAIQQGNYVAHLIADNKKTRKPFRYRDKGSMATIGYAKAVATIGKRQFSGLSAWFLWSLVHIAFLIGFRNKVIVMLEWMFWYVTGKRSSRLIWTNQNHL